MTVASRPSTPSWALTTDRARRIQAKRMTGFQIDDRSLEGARQARWRTGDPPPCPRQLCGFPDDCDAAATPASVRLQYDGIGPPGRPGLELAEFSDPCRLRCIDTRGSSVCRERSA